MNGQSRLGRSEINIKTGVAVMKKCGLPPITLHGHDFYELEIITDGSLTTICNGKVIECRRGDAFLMTPLDLHEYHSCDGATIYNLQFNGDAVSDELRMRIIGMKSRHLKPTEEVLSEVLDLLGCLMGGVASKSTAITARLLECVLILLTSEEKEAQPERSADMQKALFYIHEHFKESPTLTDAAAVLHLDPRYFCRRFKEYTGKTYKEYLIGLKLRYARRLVLSSDMPIVRIAENAGFGSQSHFNKEFRREFGQTPLRMRRVGR